MAPLLKVGFSEAPAACRQESGWGGVSQSRGEEPEGLMNTEAEMRHGCWVFKPSIPSSGLEISGLGVCYLGAAYLERRVWMRLLR